MEGRGGGTERGRCRRARRSRPFFGGELAGALRRLAGAAEALGRSLGRSAGKIEAEAGHTATVREADVRRAINSQRQEAVHGAVLRTAREDSISGRGRRGVWLQGLARAHHPIIISTYAPIGSERDSFCFIPRGGGCELDIVLAREV